MLKRSSSSKLGSSFEVLNLEESACSSSSFEVLNPEEDACSKQEYPLAKKFERSIREIIERVAEHNQSEAASIAKLWNDIKKTKKVKRESGDKENRPLFVNLQAIVESTITLFLADMTISAVGAIHTPTPATPLRTEAVTPLTSKTEVKVAKGLVTKEIENDPVRLQTVTNRAVIVREYLDEGGELYSAYHTEVDYKGKEIEGMDTFRGCLRQYTNLHAVRFNNFESKYTGATYVFGNNDQDNLVFSIKAYQANQEKPGNKWCAWFGPVSIKEKNEISSDKVEKRFKKITNFLLDNGIDMVGELKNQYPSSNLSNPEVVRQHSLESARIAP